MEYDLLIQKILRGEGYSPETALLFAAVSRHETGNYRSGVFKRDNNMFGMKNPTLRQTTSINEDSSGYAVYSTPANSVRDLALYLDALDYSRHYGTASDLVTAMKEKGYFEADFAEYLGGVERALKKVSVL